MFINLHNKFSKFLEIFSKQSVNLECNAIKF